MYEIIQDSVLKNDFITVLERNESEAELFKGIDPTARNIIEFHRRNDKQTYKLISLLDEGFKQLIVPHHIHDKDGFPGIGRDGCIIWDAVEIYLAAKHRVLQEGQTCADKVRKLVELKIWETSPTFVSNDPDFAVKGHYERRSGEFLYGGGFHRLVACGVWMKENNLYPPLKLYYCEVPKS